MKKILGTGFVSKLLLAASLVVVVSLLVTACGSNSSTSWPADTPTGTGGIPVVKHPVYQVACDSLASSASVTTVVAQGTWDETGKLVSETFTPKNLTIPLGGTVRWFNNDIPGQTAPAGTWNGYNIYSEGWLITDPTSSATTTASPWIGPGQSACLQFGTPGTYRYHCDAKTGAVGSVTVLDQ